MANSLLSLANNLANNPAKYKHDDKKCETYGIKYKNCDCFLEYINFKDDLIECRCLGCKKNFQKKV